MVSVVFVESCFRRYASYGGAVGYWQLLAATARSMGLRIDRWVDERHDPVKSTQAAAKYLRSLYDQFESWPLALAAYNAGDTPVASAMRRTRTSDFWELSRRRTLPGITRAYVPKVLAAIQIMRDLEAHGFKYPQFSRGYDFESISIKSPLRLEQVAKWIKVPVSDLQVLNPSLRLDRLPPDCGVNLNLPSGARGKFDLAYESYLRN
jgi:membrane-bound lytic murein transglycosylase D